MRSQPNAKLPVPPRPALTTALLLSLLAHVGLVLAFAGRGPAVDLPVQPLSAELMLAQPRPAMSRHAASASLPSLMKPRQARPAAVAAQPVQEPVQGLPAQSRSAEAQSSGELFRTAVRPPRFDAAHLHNPPPAYPWQARRQGLEGLVRVRARVDADGLPQAVVLAQSSGASILDRAAIAAVEGWSFLPAEQGGLAVAAWVEIPIAFTLR